MHREVGQINAPVSPAITVAGVAGHRTQLADAVLSYSVQPDPFAGDEVGDGLAAALAEALVVVRVAGVVGMTGQQQRHLGMTPHLLGDAQQQRALLRLDAGAVELKLNIALPAPTDAGRGLIRVGLCSCLS